MEMVLQAFHRVNTHSRTYDRGHTLEHAFSPIPGAMERTRDLGLGVTLSMRWSIVSPATCRAIGASRGPPTARQHVPGWTQAWWLSWHRLASDTLRSLAQHLRVCHARHAGCRYPGPATPHGWPAARLYRGFSTDIGVGQHPGNAGTGKWPIASAWTGTRLPCQ